MLLPVGNEHFDSHCGKHRISRGVNRHQNISVLSNGKSRVFDSRSPSQEGREDLPSELGFALAPRETDPKATPIMTRPSEVSRPESTSAMVTRSHAREGRGISVAPEAQIEPEIKTRPEQEKATCEGGLGTTGSFATETISLFTSADKLEVVATHTSKEVTTSLFTAPSQTAPLSWSIG